MVNKIHHKNKIDSGKDKHKPWLVFGVSIAVLLVLVLVLYSPVKKGVVGKAIGAGVCTLPSFSNGQGCFSIPENQPLTESLHSVLVETCTERNQCQYLCASGYKKEENNCVAGVSSSVGGVGQACRLESPYCNSGLSCVYGVCWLACVNNISLCVNQTDCLGAKWKWNSVTSACVDACPQSYTETGGVCTASTCTGSATQSCLITNGVGTQTRTCSGTTWSDFETCTVTSCNAGYQISGNTCIAVQTLGEKIDARLTEAEKTQRPTGTAVLSLVSKIASILRDWLAGQ